MALPFFYKVDISGEDRFVVLDEDNSKHIVQVLRMKVGEQLNITNGRGEIFICEITDDHRKRCEVRLIDKPKIIQQASKITIAVSPLKNSSRFEWFLEKATEIGITDIVPLICERTEKSQLKTERLQGILVSAMLQSQQAWLPKLHSPIKYAAFVQQTSADESIQKFIAHCEDNQKNALASVGVTQNSCILIGPEGDFTSHEIELALSLGFEPVSLGNSRLRTETAALYASVLLSRQQG